MENTFKSSVFGGFNRDDVIRYIEKTALENKQQLEQLEQENDALCRESADLRTELNEATQENELLSASYSDALEQISVLKDELSAAQESLAAVRTQLDACRKTLDTQRSENEQHLSDLEASHAERLVAAERERRRLHAELESLRPQAEEYARVKAHIADIELSARERADALDRTTRSQLSSLIETCSSRCGQLLTSLAATCADVSDELRRADEMVTNLPAAFDSLQSELNALQNFEKEV